MGAISFENKAKLACAYGGMIWGVFWLPLRALDEAGISGSWATAVFFIVPLFFLVPLILLRWKLIIHAGLKLHLIGVFSGIAMVLYSDAFLFTEVVRAMLLFYLTPIWGTILARIFLKEAITPVRVLGIVLGFSGMLVILGTDTGVPWPSNMGDWMGLASGFVWAIGMVLMRDDEGTHAIELSTVYFIWGSVAAIGFLFLPFGEGGVQPDFNNLIDTLPWLIPVLMIIVLPGVFAIMWGTPHLNPGVAGLLYMTEISVGAATAAIWAGEPFGLREITGIVLITLAGLVEVIMPYFSPFWTQREGRST